MLATTEYAGPPTTSAGTARDLQLQCQWPAARECVDELEVLQADVTKLEPAAIANAVITRLRHGGDVAAAIALAGEPEVQRESARKAPVGLGGGGRDYRRCNGRHAT